MDNEKAARNSKKHGVGFEEASTVWQDLFFVDLYDGEHSGSEKRFLIVGESKQNKLLIVSYAERANQVRIISARELTAKERKDYEHGNFE